VRVLPTFEKLTGERVLQNFEDLIKVRILPGADPEYLRGVMNLTKY